MRYGGGFVLAAAAGGLLHAYFHRAECEELVRRVCYDDPSASASRLVEEYRQKYSNFVDEMNTRVRGERRRGEGEVAEVRE